MSVSVVWGNVLNGLYDSFAEAYSVPVTVSNVAGKGWDWLLIFAACKK